MLEPLSHLGSDTTGSLILGGEVMNWTGLELIQALLPIQLLHVLMPKLALQPNTISPSLVDVLLLPQGTSRDIENAPTPPQHNTG